MKRLSLILLSAACLALSLATAMAQDKYPSRPIKVIVPYAPGGATDILARIIGDAVQKTTGQGFIVLNKPGAFGLLAIDEMAKSASDGYTLMIGNVTTNAITPVLYSKKISVDYAKDVVVVTNLVDVPAFLVVTTADNFAPKTVPESIAYAKKNPGAVHYGTVGSKDNKDGSCRFECAPSRQSRQNQSPQDYSSFGPQSSSRLLVSDIQNSERSTS